MEDKLFEQKNVTFTKKQVGQFLFLRTFALIFPLLSVGLKALSPFIPKGFIISHLLHSYLKDLAFSGEEIFFLRVLVLT